MEFSRYYFYMKTSIKGDFQTCICVSLNYFQLGKSLYYVFLFYSFGNNNLDEIKLFVVFKVSWSHNGGSIGSSQINFNWVGTSKATCTWRLVILNLLEFGDKVFSMTTWWQRNDINKFLAD